MSRRDDAFEERFADIAERPWARALMLLGRMHALGEFMLELGRTSPVVARRMSDWYAQAVREVDAEVALIERALEESDRSD
jgi:hypothetical protein